MKTRKLTWVAVLTLFAAVSPRLVAQSPQAIFRVVYTFPGGTSGSMPATGVIRDSAGNLYGTTYYGGDLTCNGYLLPGCGVIFKLDKAGRETVLYRFKGGPSDGRNPKSKLIRDNAGNLYGATFGGGAFNNSGTIFKLDTRGNEIVLHSFTGTDGNGPSVGLTLGADGALYGVTSCGGDTSCHYGYSGIPGCGVVFKVDKSGQLVAGVL
ncbi:MAG TPA: choice-of-anchor tandem repeat GloVer-containing protein [Candidatus Dormibacteraeota bacterium]|nr:choice-of-anchor tandem repeat GloVer-containing protein [Candidatus Dormibacteraeota bacterium]